MSKLIKEFEAFRDAQILSDIDLEFCRFLQSRENDMPEEVMMAACLTSYLQRQGHVCMPLKEYAGNDLFSDQVKKGSLKLSIKAPSLKHWNQKLKESNLVGSPGDFAPLILDDSHRVYLQKSWLYEYKLSQELLKRTRKEIYEYEGQTVRESLDRLYPSGDDTEPDWQKAAAFAALNSLITVISGGPGTGKTSAVIRILALLLEFGIKAGEKLDIGLAAPTGKAAARLTESVRKQKESINTSDQIKDLIPEKAVTIHQLLGARYHSSAFRFNSEHPLPYDVVIVDEVSMVDQALMGRLVEALLEDSRLVLLGDKDQLASVEAGSILGDICNVTENRFSKPFIQKTSGVGINITDEYEATGDHALTDHIVLLTKNYRFDPDSGIAGFSTHVNRGEAEKAVNLLKSAEDIAIKDFEDSKTFMQVLYDAIDKNFDSLLSASNPDEALRILSRYKMLSVHRRGILGSDWMNELIEHRLKKIHGISRHREWFSGRPVLITRNDYTLGLRNGDIGVALAEQDGDFYLYFEHQGEVRSVPASRIRYYEPAYCLTVHKSQGSEFEEIVLVLPTSESKILTRELIYTAVTRARKKITVWGNPDLLKAGISRQISRSSGLKDRLWN